MNTNELNTLLNDLHDQMAQVNENIQKHMMLDNDQAVEVLTETWHSINNRIEDVEQRIEESKRRKVRSQTEKLMSENRD